MPSSIWATKNCRQPSAAEPRPDDRGAGAVGVGLEHGGAVDRLAVGAAGVAQPAPVGGDGGEVDREDRAGPARRVVVGGQGRTSLCDLTRRRGPAPSASAAQVAELGELALEGQPHDAGRTVALLGHDHLGLAVGLLAALLPVVVALVEFLVALLGAPARLGARRGNTPRDRRTSRRRRPARSSPIRAGRRAAAACPRAARRRG